jgi:hypothetical protein
MPAVTRTLFMSLFEALHFHGIDVLIGAVEQPRTAASFGRTFKCLVGK